MITRVLGRRGISLIAVAVALILIQVWMDLKIPEYMGEITDHIVLNHSDVVMQKGTEMLTLAFGSLLVSFAAGFVLANVSALAGKISLGENNVLGIAMGTSEAAGFVDKDGCITGWLNELAFVPVDCNPDAMVDEWSGDIGCGVKYFSQDSVIKLAPRAGIELDESLSPAEKLKVVQKLMEEGAPAAEEVYQNIGVYLGHTLPYYYSLYGMKHVLLLGRVMSGKGGDLILSTCKQVIRDEYPELVDCILPSLPDEKFRRVGQSATAATLPEL